MMNSRWCWRTRALHLHMHLLFKHLVLPSKMFAFHISIKILYQCLPTMPFKNNMRKKNCFTTNWKQNDKANSIYIQPSCVFMNSIKREVWGREKRHKYDSLWKTIWNGLHFAAVWATFTFHLHGSFAFMPNKTIWSGRMVGWLCNESHVWAINFIYYLLVTAAVSLIKICTLFEIYFTWMQCKQADARRE